MKKITNTQIEQITAFTKACRKSILEMTTNAQSGHPGGSLSSIDFLSVLYSEVICQTGEKIIVSNGHISPAVYAVLAELDFIPKEKVLKTFRKSGSIFEGHITRKVTGIEYGTGPLGIGFSAAVGLALGEKKKNSKKNIYAIIGDGEMDEGQVYEAINFANQYKLNNLITLIDNNRVQLSGSLKEINDIDISKIFKAANWDVITIDGHNIKEIYEAINKSKESKTKPTAIICKTIMGKGVKLMESEGLKFKSTWHGKAASKDQIKEDLINLTLNKKEIQLINDLKKRIKIKPTKHKTFKNLEKTPIKIGKERQYSSKELTDCRSAYGNALFDLSKLNKNLIVLTADLKSSVKTDQISEKLPNQYLECSIAEQNMLSIAGSLSLNSFIPFASTFGAFMTSRAKDQVRVNDINETNVKMVATHCGLSVGEDGPTHQAIDDMNSMLGLFNTNIIEVIDPNHTDKIIRYSASHYGNFYIRMGRHKFPIITKENGNPFYDSKYKYTYGKCDIIRKGKDLTIAATGPMVHESLKAIENLKISNPKLSIELIAVSSIKKFDNTIFNSIKKTKRLLTIEDHNSISGLSSQIAKEILNKNIQLKSFTNLGVKEYQLSGTVEKLYDSSGISDNKITKQILKIIKK